MSTEKEKVEKYVIEEPQKVETFIKPRIVKENYFILNKKKKYEKLNGLSLLPYMTLGKYKPIGQIILFIELQNDGTGDYGWIKEYINLFLSIGYEKKNIYIICMLEFKITIEDQKDFTLLEFGTLSNYFTKLKERLDFAGTPILTSDSEKLEKIATNAGKLNDYIKSLKNALDTAYVDNKLMSDALGSLFYNPHNIKEIYNEIITTVDRLRQDYSVYFEQIDRECAGVMGDAKCVLSAKFKINLVSLYNELFSKLDLIKNESFVHGVNFAVTDMLYAMDGETNILGVDDANSAGIGYCRVIDGEKSHRLNDAIIITFTSSNLPNIFNEKCKNFKVIEMQEGGMIHSNVTNNKMISSGIGDGLLGLYNSTLSIKIPERSFIIRKLREFTQIDDKFSEKSIYHYAYIGQLTDAIQHCPQLYKFIVQQWLILMIMNDDEEHYLFSYKKVANMQAYNDRIKKNLNVEDDRNFANIASVAGAIFKMLGADGLTITAKEKDNYDLIYKNGKKIRTLKVRYFERLDKRLFLGMVAHATSPVFSTGDLSSQEALISGKYLIHDYIPNKQSMVKYFCQEINSYINNVRRVEKEGELDLSAIDHFYTLLDQKEKIPITKSAKDIIEKASVAFKYHIEYYPRFKKDVIDTIYDMNNNFPVLLAVVDSMNLKGFYTSGANVGPLIKELKRVHDVVNQPTASASATATASASASGEHRGGYYANNKYYIIYDKAKSDYSTIKRLF